jgi:tRNA(Leu) C34 or U34 (ribose-2'-O)-methylase TrmL
VLVFGRETGGLPAAVHERYGDRVVAMPMMSPHIRSLNLSTSVGIAVYEVLRQRRATATLSDWRPSTSGTLPPDLGQRP